MVLPLAWKPVASEGLALVGPREDGGYVTTEAAIAPVDVLISMGLGDDWRFEVDFQRRSGARVVVYDHTVGWTSWPMYLAKSVYRRHWGNLVKPLGYARFLMRRHVRHVRSAVGDGTSGTVSLSQIVEDLPRDATLFLKMDIEGAEYPVLRDLVALRHRFTAMVMELHDIAEHRQDIDAFFAAMDDFAIVSAHPNNYYPVDADGDPRLLEVSLTRRDLVKENPAARPITMPQTIAANPDIELRFG
jgi:hypothetical protein